MSVQNVATTFYCETMYWETNWKGRPLLIINATYAGTTIICTIRISRLQWTETYISMREREIVSGATGYRFGDSTQTHISLWNEHTLKFSDWIASIFFFFSLVATFSFASFSFKRFIGLFVAILMYDFSNALLCEVNWNRIDDTFGNLISNIIQWE